VDQQEAGGRLILSSQFRERGFELAVGGAQANAQPGAGAGGGKDRFGIAGFRGCGGVGRCECRQQTKDRRGKDFHRFAPCAQPPRVGRFFKPSREPD
jgi:hypothetical protein